MIRLRPEERQDVTQFIYSLCAISLDASKDYLIEGRLGRLVTESGAGSFSQFVSIAKADATGHLRRRIIDEITTNETFFFRDSSPFELLRHKLLPEILDRRRGAAATTPIRIWSAASSTGQEIYSIAILIRELVGDTRRYNFQLVGTDISDDAVARASKAIFSEVEIARGLADAQRDRCFTRIPEGWKLRDELRAMASFKKFNLMHDLSPLGRFDLILCRNVAIYFNQPDRISLFGRIANQMTPESSLIVGSTESLNGIGPQFEAKRHLHAVFYQLDRGKSVR